MKSLRRNGRGTDRGRLAGALAFAMLAFFLMTSGCGTKQPTPEPTAAAPAESVPATPSAAETAEQPAAPPAEAPKAEPQPPAEDAAKSDAAPAADDKGTTPARPSLLFSLMMEPMGLIMQSSMESIQGMAGPLMGGGVPGVPGLGGGNTPAPAEKPKDQSSDGADSKPEDKNEPPDDQ